MTKHISIERVTEDRWLLAWYVPNRSMPSRPPDVIHRVSSNLTDLPSQLAGMYLPITPLGECWIFEIDDVGNCQGWNIPVSER